MAYISFSFRKFVHRRFHMQWVKSDRIHSNLQDVLSGMSVVKSYGKEEEEAEHFNRTADEFAVVQFQNEKFWAVFFPSLQFIVSVGVYLVTYFGGVRVLSGEKTVGELMQFIAYVSMLYQYVGWITNLPRQLMNVVTSLERISDVMSQEPEIFDTEKSKELKIKGRVQLKDASFGYKSYTYIHMGGKIAVVVVLDKEDAELGKGLAMHIAANNPSYLNTDAIGADAIEHETKIQLEAAKQDPKLAGKPEEMLKKIIGGKVNKYFAEMVLVEQPYLLDTESGKKVGQVLQEKKANVLKYVRYQVGEGIEKRKDDFASEVMSQMK